MTRHVFADTSAWVSLFGSREGRHARAKKEWREMLAAGEILVTTDYILAETATLLAARAGAAAAAAAYRALLESRRLRRLSVWPELVPAGLETFAKFSDHPVSFTDATSFAAMRALSIEHAWTYDADFRRAGFALRFP